MRQVIFQPKLKIACVLGTRPEIIKFSPLINALRTSPVLEPIVISSGQHRELAVLACGAFGLDFDADLDLMQEDQSPVEFLSLLMPKLTARLAEIRPSAVLVQGDTTTALGGALCAHHLKLPVGHIEAGLRTGDLYSPFPEEMNRCLISRIAAFNFCPTPRAQANLAAENVPGETFVVGNTVVDAALQVRSALAAGRLSIASELQDVLGAHRKTIFVTGHRRENFDLPLKNLCRALKELVRQEPQAAVVFPVHPNPNVRNLVLAELKGVERIYTMDPIDYPSSIALIAESALVISDSGGIQEEAPSFATPVIVTRRLTERQEGLEAGTSYLCALDDPASLVAKALELLALNRRQTKANPFGDGHSARRIKKLLEERLNAPVGA